jgi:hypothetical protein
MRKECNRVTSSDVMNLSDFFPVSPRVRHFLVQRIHLSHFYVKREFPFGGINVWEVLKLFTKESVIKKTYASGNLPSPLFAKEG